VELGQFCYHDDGEPPQNDAPSFDALEHSATDAWLPRSFEKLQRMLESVRANQFASFTE